MPGRGGNRNQGSAHQPSLASPILPPNSNAVLREYFQDRDGFSYNPSNPAWKEFRRLARYLHWSDKEITAEKENFKDVLAQTFNYMYGTDENSLESWTALCHVLGITPAPEELQTCREAVKATHVNLVDLVDHPHTGEPVRLFTTEAELGEYTRRTGKFFPRESAYAGGLLKHLLRHIISRPGIGYRGQTTRSRRH